MAGFRANRQFYIGLDFDLTHIRSRSKLLNTAIYILNLVKLPAPAIELSGGDVSFNVLQF
jgi:hypothetical protein